jgi:hypothetical protein
MSRHGVAAVLKIRMKFGISQLAIHLLRYKNLYFALRQLN